MLRLGMLSPADFLQDVPRAQAGARGSHDEPAGESGFIMQLA